MDAPELHMGLLVAVAGGDDVVAALVGLARPREPVHLSTWSINRPIRVND
jgi:sugar (pentulose or hexulose) kinase